MLNAMNPADSALDTAAIAYARALLRKPARRQKMAPVLAAAAFAACSALTFAVVMVMAPPAVIQHLPSERLGD
jgi:transcription initiation factor TFIIIB Brf1 subunit/transcription initiation factor TFIIB